MLQIAQAKSVNGASSIVTRGYYATTTIRLSLSSGVGNPEAQQPELRATAIFSIERQTLSNVSPHAQAANGSNQEVWSGCADQKLDDNMIATTIFLRTLFDLMRPEFSRQLNSTTFDLFHATPLGALAQQKRFATRQALGSTQQRASPLLALFSAPSCRVASPPRVSPF